MAKAYKVSKAFQSTNQDTKEPDIITTGGGDMHKWMFQVEGQDKPGWMQLLKKPGNELKPGDEVYGIIDEWPGGKAKFVKQDRPQGERPAPTGALPTPPATANGSDNTVESLHEKVDFLITLVENFLESQGAAKTERTTSNEGSEDDGSKPLDLSEIPY